MALEYDEIGAIENALGKAQTVSRVLYRVFTIVFWLGLVSCVAIIVTIVANGAINYFDVNAVSFLVSLSKAALEALLVLLIIQIMRSGFRDIALGKSPFTQSQASRLRIVALLLIIHALLTTFSSPAILGIAGLNGAVIGLATCSAPVEAAARIIPINVGDIVLAIVLFCAALIVEYGSLLQKLSDDTL